MKKEVGGTITNVYSPASGVKGEGAIRMTDPDICTFDASKNT